MSDCVAAFVLATVAACWTVASLAGELPDRKLSPGTVNAAISEQQYRAQCHAKGWTRLYRPPVSFTNSLKKLQMKEYGYPLARTRDYEEDHVVPLCLAGAPQDPANLRPQPRFGEWSVDRKDVLGRSSVGLPATAKYRWRKRNARSRRIGSWPIGSTSALIRVRLNAQGCVQSVTSIKTMTFAASSVLQKPGMLPLML